MARHKLIIGCGYLGLRVARRWVERGDDVVALTRSAARGEALRQLGIAPLLGDVTNEASLACLPPADVVLYAVGLDRAAGHSQREVYVEGLRHVLASTVRRSNRFIYISSTSVYGQDAGELVNESSECRPSSQSGQVCLEAEELMRSEIPDAMILRLAGIYGPGRLAARVAQLRAGQPVDGSPEAWLNLIHVDDAVAAVLACERRGCAGDTCLVCDDVPQRRGNYYRLLARLVGLPEPQFAKPSHAGPAGLNKRCSNRRLREVLSVELQYPSVTEGLPAALREAPDPSL